MGAVFLKNDEKIFYLISGDKEKLQGCACSGFEVLDAEQSEGAGEKHLPVVKKDGNKITVNVGSILHPMTEEHSIDWIFLETKKGGQLVRLSPSCEPIAEFILTDGDEAVAAYAYCNLHGFWKSAL
ncbi:MAG: desulfoferrodoxin [Clostridium sp.]|nr:desulfoferrodoxin [Clostridium sp.]MCM1209846.1 desulfoferrodoxin [Ruminococcus sp.]